ncbi:MAG: DUF1924 domain-containing protein [Rhodospirillales bacterium]|nr:DUF1924 domain-containing protein [Rhodospirillales bacterium]
MMKRLILASLSALLMTGPAFASGERQAILDQFSAQAKQQDPAFKGFSAEKGQTMFMGKHAGGKPETPSCTTCHTQDPKGSGQTKAGKEIKPMAVSRNPARYTDPAEIEKWFGRNCNQVLGRDCTASEKGDFITFMIGQ